MPSAFDFSASPFDTLAVSERQIVLNAVDIAYFREEDTILDDGAVPPGLFVVIKGHVLHYDGDELVATLGPGDCFDGRSLVAGRASGRFVAAEEVLAYQIATEAVHQLISSNTAFSALLFSDLSNKLGALSDRHHQREMQALTMSHVREAFLREAREITAETDLVAAARSMHEHRSTSVLVRDGARLGIFTNTGLQRAVAYATKPLTMTPVSDYASFNLITIDAEAPLFDALTLMIQHQVHRLVVTGEDGAVVGVLEQLDLLSYLSNHSYLITAQILRAADLDALVEPATRITRFVSVLYRGGTRIEQIGRLVQTLNAKLFERTWQLIAPPALQAASCLFVMGSEGRGEQLLKTDQDNGLVIDDDAPIDDAQIADACERFSAALRRFGYPDCPGGIMVSQPQWRQRSTAFRHTVRRWLVQPDAESLMALAIFVDAHPVCGNAALLDNLRAEIDARVGRDDAWLARFAAAVDAFPGPTGGLWSRILSIGEQDKHTLDVKKAGIFPIVHGVRSLALREHVHDTSTVARLHALEKAGRLPQAMVADLTEAMHFLMGLKLKAGIDQIEIDRSPNVGVSAEHLSSLQRDLLKDSLAVVKRFKQLVRQQFHLSDG